MGVGSREFFYMKKRHEGIKLSAVSDQRLVCWYGRERLREMLGLTLSSLLGHIRLKSRWQFRPNDTGDELAWLLSAVSRPGLGGRAKITSAFSGWFFWRILELGCPGLWTKAGWLRDFVRHKHSDDWGAAVRNGYGIWLDG